MLELEKPVETIKGIGPKTSLLFNRINIFTIKDLIEHFPRAYEDRNVTKPIYSLKDGDTVSVTGYISLIDKGHYTKTGKYMTKVYLKNDTGVIAGVWFNQRYISKNFKIGTKYLFYGRVSKRLGERDIINPEYELMEDSSLGGIIPIYPSTQNLSQRVIRNALSEVLNSREIKFEESLPNGILKKYGLCNMHDAFYDIHFPSDISKVEASVERIKFEELLILQLGLLMEKEKINKNKGIKFEISNELKDFVSSLKFELTNAQKRAVNEILNDMKSERQMNRLVQGDVGSGKTIVAAIAIFNAVKCGYQCALMAPTEVLSHQHYETLSALFKGFDINVELLSGDISKKQKDEIKERLYLGQIDVIVGTHAVIQSDVKFKKLGIVITDEQHRFGVRQRALLNMKGKNPDVLVMTATPIPRTMALFIYGDLDISVIDELPPSRQKVDTYAVKPNVKARVYNFVNREILKGRQAYVICPLVEESDMLDAESAMETAKKLKKGYLKDARLGLLHGRMKPDEKEEVMSEFKKGKIDVLISTTVIEVGIDVPNATVMVIENADRFGLAQLHQLRGRVGRGDKKSYCILISDMDTDESRMRMKIMQTISDGFKIAQKDMEIRGTGEFFGMKQHGLPELKLADIFRDSKILRLTNGLSKELLSSGAIYSDEYYKLRKKVMEKFKEKAQKVSFN